MAVGLVIYDRNTLGIIGLLRLSNEADAELYPERPETQEKFRIPVDHAIFGDQRKWSVQDGGLVFNESKDGGGRP